MIRILLADDQRLFTEGVRALIEQIDDMEVVGTASDGEEAVRFMEHSEVDVILMDIYMPRVSGIIATTHLKDNYPDVKIILLTSFADEDLVVAGLVWGADGFLLKSLDATRLIQSIRNAYDDQVVISGEAASILAKKIQGFKYSKKQLLGRELDKRHIHMTRRELDIAYLIMKETTNKYIAQQLFLSEGTIKNYISEIYNKIDIHHRKDVIVYLRGLLPENT
ncbi:response regulator transcription factor [Virgibacillus sp. NKC19-16]|uniref:response regulator transcription factor n=1 Tax=Virgibacillus salidurans TaxID=2831673 RepID=UPI001F36C4EB|nr:response regulator transcription factor [Virgibacillus sp. NKC19-16]UJL45822.1 response regulator transcription factor [Virgibacillus sp. NKC19-16]